MLMEAMQKYDFATFREQPVVNVKEPGVDVKNQEWITEKLRGHGLAMPRTASWM